MLRAIALNTFSSDVSTPFLPNGSRYHYYKTDRAQEGAFQHLFFLMEVATMGSMPC